ncbi:MAG: hypothetical protein JW864_16510 [Spirochaetes bacterium]|nr:hypothetical protein [Spirochaetota bacterium]
MDNVLEKLASSMGRRDDEPNKELAAGLVEKEDRKAIAVIAENLWNKDKKIRTDCLKVLYETGYLNPDLIKPYGEDFLKCIRSNDNRFIWGGMIALSAIADKSEKLIIDNFDLIIKTIEKGSVITVDAGILTLAKGASGNTASNKKIFPYLLQHLKKCRPKEVAQHSESIFPAVNDANKQEFLKVLNSRENDLSSSQLTRIKKIYKKLQ